MKLSTLKKIISVIFFLFSNNLLSSEIFKNYRVNGIDIYLSSKFENSEVDIILNDLKQLEEIPESNLNSKLHEKIFHGPVSGKIYFPWLTKRIVYFGKGKKKYLKKFSFIAEHVIGSNGSKKIDLILFYDNYFLEKNQYSRFTTLIHEAKHAESSIYNHTPCPPYFIDTFPSDRLSKLTLTTVCDNTWDSSYGAELIFLFYLEKLLGPNIVNIKPETSYAAGRITNIISRCELNMDFWPEQFKTSSNCI